MDGQGKEAVEGVKRVKVEIDTGGVKERVGNVRVVQLIDQRGLEPPQVPVILPAVKAVTGNGGGQVLDERPGHKDSEQQIEQEHAQRLAAAAPRLRSQRRGG